MATLDFWELDDPFDMPSVWQKLIGQERENPDETRAQMDVILGDHPGGFHCLELGCGVGRLLVELESRHLFLEHHGIDTSVSIVLAAQRYLTAHNSSAIIRNGNGISLPYPDDYFSLVYSFTVFQHMRSLALIHCNLMEIRRVLTSQGIARIQTVACGPDIEPFDFTRYDGRVFHGIDDYTSTLQSAGFQVISCEQGLTHPDHLWATIQRER